MSAASSARRQATTKKATSKPSSKSTADRHAHGHSYCSLRPTTTREFSPDVNSVRAELIRLIATKWVNGTVLHYYFFDRNTDGQNITMSDGSKVWRPWTTTTAEKDVVRAAFKVWADVGIGLRFVEVNSRDEAEVRIGFMRDDGAWSYIGRDILDFGRDQRTMNFGWDLTRSADELDTAVHEIGHTLGFPHEHQNPNAGIVWDEEAVYTALAQPPNRWNREKTFWNIIRKIEPDSVQGSNWDPDSIMHYPFGPGLIKLPIPFRAGLQPAGGLSDRDKTWVKTFYPPLSPADHSVLVPFKSNPLSLTAGEQANFTFIPAATRNYEIKTFGTSDTVMVLFEDTGGEPRYMTGDDDSGEDWNAYIRTKLYKGRKYIVRLRLYYAERTGDTAIMLW